MGNVSRIRLLVGISYCNKKKKKRKKKLFIPTNCFRDIWGPFNLGVLHLNDLLPRKC